MAEPTVPSTREESAPRETTRTQEQYIQPPVDIYEAGDGLMVVADMPGVVSEDLDIRVERNILTLQAKAKPVLPGDPYYREYHLVNFFRQFQLSDEVDANNITADLKNGVLSLTLPKSEAAKPRRIQVRTE